jgi:hypothetical protein
LTPEKYAWQAEYGWWGEIYTVTFAFGHEEYEVLHRFGVIDEDIALVTAEDFYERASQRQGACDMVAVRRTGDWVIGIEADGYEGARLEVLREMSRGGEAVSVMRHDYAASHRFGHAVNGELRTGFAVQTPQDRYGDDPDGLIADMSELGLDPYPEDDFQYISDGVPRALALASRLSGVLFTADLLDEPLLGGIITIPVPNDDERV